MTLLIAALLLLSHTAAYVAGGMTGETVGARLKYALSEENFVGCKPMDNHPGMALCGPYAVAGMEDLIAEIRSSPDETDEFKPGIDCRVWKSKLLRFVLGPVHSCSTAVG
jgi:hypothetical protein